MARTSFLNLKIIRTIPRRVSAGLSFLNYSILGTYFHRTDGGLGFTIQGARMLAYTGDALPDNIEGASRYR